MIVSYNGDLRGVIEDLGKPARDIRCALGSFSHIGEVVDGSALLATVPAFVAAQVRATRPHLRTATLPFRLAGTPVELLWPVALTAIRPARSCARGSSSSRATWRSALSAS